MSRLLNDSLKLVYMSKLLNDFTKTGLYVKTTELFHENWFIWPLEHIHSLVFGSNMCEVKSV